MQINIGQTKETRETLQNMMLRCVCVCVCVFGLVHSASSVKHSICFWLLFLYFSSRVGN